MIKKILCLSLISVFFHPLYAMYKCQVKLSPIERLSAYSEKLDDAREDLLNKCDFRLAFIEKCKQKVRTQMNCDLTTFAPIFGRLVETQYEPKSSPLNFKYDLFYYVPTRLKMLPNRKAMVFLHGGGGSTTTREGSKSAVRMYMKDFIKVAEELGVVLVAPSGSGLNWGGHMLHMLRELNQHMVESLKVNRDKIALIGHSMGGMGITRSAHWLSDQYSFFMPISAGMDERHMTEQNLAPYFNIRYHHIQGLRDHFDIFIKRAKLQKELITKMEEESLRKSGYVLDFYNGSHNYPLDLVKKRIKENFKYKREMFQDQLSGMFYNIDEVRKDRHLNKNYYLAPRKDYFWLEARGFSKSKKVINFNAYSVGNLVSINIDEGVSKLRVYLSSKKVVFSEQVEILVNSKLYFYGKVKKTAITDTRKNMYDGFVDIELK